MKIIILEAVPGKVMRDASLRAVANALLEIPLYAVRSDASLWRMKYKPPARLPPALQGLQFTNFNLLCREAEKYFLTRNIRIKEIQDLTEDNI